MVSTKKDLENAKDVKEKPSFFSMSSPTLDALILKVKSLLKSPADQNVESNQVDTPKPVSTVSQQDSNVSQQDSKNQDDDVSQEVVEEVMLEEVVISKVETNDTKDTKEETSIVAETETKEDQVTTEDVADDHETDKEIIQDNNTDNDDITEEVFDDITNVETSVTEEDTTLAVQEDDMVVEAGVDINEVADSPISDEDVVTTEEADEVSHTSDSKLIAQTLFKSNSVLGNLDDQVLKSFPRKKTDYLKKK